MDADTKLLLPFHDPSALDVNVRLARHPGSAGSAAPLLTPAALTARSPSPHLLLPEFNALAADRTCGALAQAAAPAATPRR